MLLLQRVGILAILVRPCVCTKNTGLLVDCENSIGALGDPVTLKCSVNYSNIPDGAKCGFRYFHWKMGSETKICDQTCQEPTENNSAYRCDDIIKNFSCIIKNASKRNEADYTFFVQTICGDASKEMSLTLKESTAPPTPSPSAESAAPASPRRGAASAPEESGSQRGVPALIIIIITIAVLAIIVLTLLGYRRKFDNFSCVRMSNDSNTGDMERNQDSAECKPLSV